MSKRLAHKAEDAALLLLLFLFGFIVVGFCGIGFQIIGRAW